MPAPRQQTYISGGLGPYLDGLFTQSNFGIVTEIGVSLMPVPEAFEACYFSCNSEGQLGPLIEGIQQLIVCGLLSGSNESAAS